MVDESAVGLILSTQLDKQEREIGGCGLIWVAEELETVYSERGEKVLAVTTRLWLRFLVLLKEEIRL